jgi:hypothetical protein
MAHYDIYRDRLATTHAAFGHALWEPSPDGGYGSVKIGDVGYVSEGKFHRLFNALLPSDDASHQGTPLPEYHEPFIPPILDHLSRGVLTPNTYYSTGVEVFPEKPEHLVSE